MKFSARVYKVEGDIGGNRRGHQVYLLLGRTIGSPPIPGRRRGHHHDRAPQVSRATLLAECDMLADLGEPDLDDEQYAIIVAKLVPALAAEVRRLAAALEQIAALPERWTTAEAYVRAAQVGLVAPGIARDALDA